VFLFGAVVTAVMIPLVALLVPETPAFYAARRPEGALEKTNRSLRALRKPEITAMPEISPTAPKPKVTDILSNARLRPVTLLLAFGYLFHTITFYYILKFAVQIVADSGFSQPEAASTLTWANIGGATGGALFGFLMRSGTSSGRRSPRRARLGGGRRVRHGQRHAVGLARGHLPDDVLPQRRDRRLLRRLREGFPAYARATGTGFVLGVGRAGAAGSPIIAGLPVHRARQRELLTVSAIMSIGAILGAGLIWMLPMRDADREADERAAT
jgi:hypothetical protein